MSVHIIITEKVLSSTRGKYYCHRELLLHFRKSEERVEWQAYYN